MATPQHRSLSSTAAARRAGKPILVTGATGRQGGATAVRLLADGWPVRVLVREPAAAAVRELAAAGAEPLQGDLDDPGSLKAAMAGAHGVFAVTPDDLDSEREIRRGRHLADAAAAAGVAHLVFTSVGGAERGTGISYWESKWAIERHIAALGLPATVLRPVRFMENHAIPGLRLGGISADGVLRHLFGSDVPVQLIAVTDIGAFAALAFADPAAYLGQALELAGDELTPDATVRLISRHLGRQITYQQVAGEGLSMDTARAFTAQRGLWRADITALRHRHPGLLDFPAWLERGGARAIAALLDG
ncbi:NmrA family NAD(P)-binding protein [Nonomuraea sp. K274]|uniref:NmrA family NAD(P)-binding protein n=1 Tax=Nonomuraea cypriaca TaxID=1187855 RepID=A0A931AF78_9ACTN|nr:NmrA family NAD(P)-binding protein [Nonomuraea cypriaca]MBF8189969.1 NmrA family NAD(P)-binding protein [Nonomuraea cypriaca]